MKIVFPLLEKIFNLFHSLIIVIIIDIEIGIFMNLILCNENNSRVKQLKSPLHNLVSVDELLQQVSFAITCNSQFSMILCKSHSWKGSERENLCERVWKCRKCKIRIREINSASVYYACMWNFSLQFENLCSRQPPYRILPLQLWINLNFCGFYVIL